MKQDFLMSKGCQQMLTFNPRDKCMPLSQVEIG